MIFYWATLVICFLHIIIIIIIIIINIITTVHRPGFALKMAVNGQIICMIYDGGLVTWSKDKRAKVKLLFGVSGIIQSVPSINGKDILLFPLLFFPQ